MNIIISVSVSILVGIFFGVLPLAIAYVLVHLEKDKPKGEGLNFKNLDVEVPFWEKIPGFHIATGLLAVMLILTPFVIAVMAGIFTIPIVEYLIIRSILPFISVAFLVMIHQGIIWNMLNPSSKFGAKNLWNNYRESGEIPRVAFLALISLIIAMAIGMAAEWLVVFIVMMIITGFTVMWRSGKEKDEAISTA